MVLLHRETADKRRLEVHLGEKKVDLHVSLDKSLSHLEDSRDISLSGQETAGLIKGLVEKHQHAGRDTAHQRSLGIALSVLYHTYGDISNQHLGGSLDYVGSVSGSHRSAGDLDGVDLTITEKTHGAVSRTGFEDLYQMAQRRDPQGRAALKEEMYTDRSDTVNPAVHLQLAEIVLGRQMTHTQVAELYSGKTYPPGDESRISQWSDFSVADMVLLQESGLRHTPNWNFDGLPQALKSIEDRREHHPTPDFVKQQSPTEYGSRASSDNHNSTLSDPYSRHFQEILSDGLEDASPLELRRIMDGSIVLDLGATNAPRMSSVAHACGARGCIVNDHDLKDDHGTNWVEVADTYSYLDYLGTYVNRSKKGMENSQVDKDAKLATRLLRTAQHASNKSNDMDLQLVEGDMLKYLQSLPSENSGISVICLNGIDDIVEKQGWKHKEVAYHISRILPVGGTVIANGSKGSDYFERYGLEPVPEVDYMWRKKTPTPQA